MTATSFDPFRAERNTRWRNRVARWREQPGQTALHVAALAAFGLLLLPIARHAIGGLAEPMLSLLQRWPVPVILVLAFALTWRQARRRQDLAQVEGREWWIAQPIPDARRVARRRTWQALEAAVQLATGMVLLLLIGAPRMSIAYLGVLVALALAGSPWLARRLALHETQRVEAGSRLRDAGVGRLWRWQRIETGVALGGRALAFGLWALLLVPMGSGPGVVIVVLAAGLLVAMLATAWSRSVGVLPRAHAWLSMQPMRGTTWLLALGGVPFAILLLACAMLASVLMALGTPMLAMGAVMALGAIALLQFACSFGWRDQPDRVALQLVLHLVLLLGMVQAFAPLALPLWVAQILWLLNRGVRA